MNIIILSVILTIGILYTLYIVFFVRLSKRHIYCIGVDEFENQLTATKDTQIIDVRTPCEYKKHRISGAKNIDMLSFNFSKEIKKLDITKPVMIYCLSGVRSKMVLPKFHKAGFTTIYELGPGFDGWLKAGKTIEKDLRK